VWIVHGSHSGPPLHQIVQSLGPVSNEERLPIRLRPQIRDEQDHPGPATAALAARQRQEMILVMTRSVILTWLPMATSARRMLMAVPIMVVPDGADVARIGFEEESGDGVDA
jgi:hypothetical protein